MEITEVDKLVWIGVLICGEYLMVLFAVIADLISGVRKAKAIGEARRSKAFRRTVDKVVRYYNALFALTVIDVMQMAGVIYLKIIEDISFIPVIPLFTLLGSLGIALIEVKSIYEKAEEKEQRQYRDVADLLIKALKNTQVKDLIEDQKKEKPL